MIARPEPAGVRGWHEQDLVEAAGRRKAGPGARGHCGREDQRASFAADAIDFGEELVDEVPPAVGSRPGRGEGVDFIEEEDARLLRRACRRVAGFFRWGRSTCPGRR